MRLSTVIILSLFAQGHCYCRSTCNASSAHAPSLCHLASPDLDLKPTGTYVNRSGTADCQKGEPSTDEALWVGYVKNFTTFAYIGCALRSTIDANHAGRTWHIPADPGLCYSKCRTPYVGIGMLSKNKPVCFCIYATMLPAKRQLTGNNCTKLCQNPPGALCGDDGTVSIYEKANLSIKLETDIFNQYIHWFPGNGKHCVSHTVGAYSLLRPCHDSFRSRCVTVNGKPSDYTEVAASWAESMKSCLSRGLLPTYSTPDMTSPDAEMTSRVWLSVIWGYSIVKLPDVHDEYSLQGYIKNSPSGTQLFFKPTNETRHALCDKGDEPSQCTSVSTATTGLGNKIILSSRTGIPAFTTLPPNEEDPWYDKWFYDVMLAVGALVFVILLYLLCRKRTNVPDLAKQSDESKYIGDDPQCQYVSSNQSEMSERSERSEHIYLEIGDQPSSSNTYVNVNNGYEMPQ